ncbi:MAG TPA: hypothetical protein VGJ20_38135 [Xanthobacteraceae bacterium]|jgi:hypothetical protein
MMSQSALFFLQAQTLQRGNPVGAFLGPLRDASGKPIEIDDVWALQFGNDTGPNTAHNQLFFTAGPNNYANGLYGVITVGL